MNILYAFAVIFPVVALLGMMLYIIWPRNARK